MKLTVFSKDRRRNWSRDRLQYIQGKGIRTRYSTVLLGWFWGGIHYLKVRAHGLFAVMLKKIDEANLSLHLLFTVTSSQYLGSGHSCICQNVVTSRCLWLSSPASDVDDWALLTVNETTLHNKKMTLWNLRDHFIKTIYLTYLWFNSKSCFRNISWWAVISAVAQLEEIRTLISN